MLRRLPVALTLVAALAFGFAACGDDSNDTATDSSTTTSASSSSGSTTSAPLAGSTVATRRTALGTVLVNGEGLTLYAFDNDKDGTPTCTGGCADAWPPLLVEGDITVGEGLDAADFTTVDNPDGGKQLSVDSKPLYLYSGDAAAGDVNGQGVGDVWHAVAVDGSVITATTPDSTGSGY